MGELQISHGSVGVLVIRWDGKTGQHIRKGGEWRVGGGGGEITIKRIFKKM